MQARSQPSPFANPVYQRSGVASESEATIAQLRTRVAGIRCGYSRLETRAKVMPQMEAEFAQLNRDYDVHKKNYETLVSRRESAEYRGTWRRSRS